jgi:hypothetical protein
MPHRPQEADDVYDAPCLRVPSHAHRIVGLLGPLTGGAATDGEVRVT